MTTDIVDLFASGEEGVWFNPRDKTKMWTDTSRTTNVTASGDTIAVQWSQGTGPQLWADQTPTVDNSTTGSDGAYVASTNTMTNTTAGSSASYPRFDFDLGLTATSKYEVRGQLSGDIDKIHSIRLDSGTALIAYDSSTGVFDGANIAASDTLQFLTDGTGGALSITIDSISVRKISDITREQATAGSRPFYRERADGTPYIDYATARTLTFTNSMAGLKWLHDGTGGTYVAWLEWGPNQDADRYVESITGTTQVGIRFNKAVTNTNSQYLIARGVSGQLVGTAVLDDTLTGDIIMHRYSYKNNGDSTDIIGMIDSCVTSAYSAQQTNAPSSADAAANLAVVTSFDSIEYDVILINRVLTQSESQDVYNFLKDDIRYVVPSSHDLGFYLIAQSNMVGTNSLSGVTPETPVEGVNTYHKSEEFRRAAVPEHSTYNVPVPTSPASVATAAGQGLALPAAKYLNTNYSKTVMLVPTAVGGTSIAQWDRPQDIGDRTTLLGASVYRYQQAASRFTLPIIIIYGHEASREIAYNDLDFTNGGVGTDYVNDFISLINTVRTNTAPDAHLIIVQLAGENVLLDAEKQAAACEALRQCEYKVPWAHMVVAHDLKRNASTDDIHVSAEGQKILGERVGKAIAEHILGEAVNGTGPRLSSVYKTDTSEITVTLNKEVNTTAGDYGDLFRVYSEGSEITVSSAVRGTNTSTVVITCAVPVVLPATVTYGYKAGPNNAARTDFVKDSDDLPLPVFGPVKVLTPPAGANGVGGGNTLLLGAG